MFFATLSLGLVLLPFAAAQQVHDVQVGSTDGSSLAFSPEAIVRDLFTCTGFSLNIGHEYYRALIPVIKSSSTCK